MTRCLVQKGTKNALETGRTFATLFADMDLRLNLLHTVNQISVAGPRTWTQFQLQEVESRTTEDAERECREGVRTGLILRLNLLSARSEDEFKQLMWEHMKELAEGLCGVRSVVSVTHVE